MQGRGFDDALGHWVWGFLSGLNAAEEAEGRPTRSVRTPNSPAGAAGLAYDLCARQPSEERVTTVMRAYFLSQPTTPLEFQPFTK